MDGNLIVVPLHCAVQDYAWGKIGDSSTVAQLAAANNPAFKIEAKKPYAELWMGTHPRGPSYAVIDGKSQLLADFLKANPSLCGDFATVDGQLPYLFKVLSVREMLSIQAHPDKALAKILRANDPKNYPDDNHKPEMAIALTSFDGLCGFRPALEISGFLDTIPEFRAAVGNDVAVAFENSVHSADTQAQLKNLFTKLMTADAAMVASQVSALETRLKAVPEAKRSLIEKMFIKIAGQYPGDVGCFCLFILNLVQMAPGEAIFLGPNLPHAYIFGDCIECMACSDNVVRAGCTSKFKDVKNLVEMLAYQMASDRDQLMHPEPHEACKAVLMYDAPVDDFKVARVELQPRQTSTVPAELGPSILLTVEGQGRLNGRVANQTTTAPSHDYHKGSIYFIAANAEIQIEPKSHSLFYRAFVR